MYMYVCIHTYMYTCVFELRAQLSGRYTRIYIYINTFICVYIFENNSPRNSEGDVGHER